MGGVATDVVGRASKPGLWVVGEAASTGVHGANRLASNSLLEGVVMGRAAAAEIRMTVIPKVDRVAVPADALHLGTHDPALFAKVRSLLWRHAGVVRNDADLREGLAALDWLQLQGAGPAVRNALEVARLVLRAALDRTESRGAHFRSDFPEADLTQASRRFDHPDAAPHVEFDIVGQTARVHSLAPSDPAVAA